MINKKGRPRKDSKMNELGGNPGNRKTPVLEENIDVSTGALTVPGVLRPNERVFWRQVVTAFPSFGAEKHLLITYYQVMVRLQKARAVMAKSPLIITRAYGSEATVRVKGRRMTSAPTSPVSPLIPATASRYTGARPSRLKQIYGTVAQKSPEPLKNNAYRRRTCKIDDVSEPTGPWNASCPISPKAVAKLKSP